MWLLRLPILVVVLAYQSMFLALGQIWNNKLRSMLTTVGIVIGVASVTAVIAALTGMKENVLAEFEALGTNKIFINPSFPTSGHGRYTSFLMIRFRPETFDGLLQSCPSVRTLTRQTSQTQVIRFADKKEEEVEVNGIDPDWHSIENRYVSVGRPFSLVDSEQCRPVCLVNEKLQAKLGLNRDPSGQQILIGDRLFVVVGVMESRTGTSMFGRNSNDSEVFIPFTTAWLSAKRKQYLPYMSVVAVSRGPSVSLDAQAEIKYFLRKRRKLQPGDEDTFRVQAVNEMLEGFQSIASAITAVATGVVGISLLVGGVGIMNIMLVSVSERTREIGLRKAVGARPGAILLQFLVEAVTLCLIGGLVGILAGQGLTMGMAAIPAAKLTKAYIPGWAFAVSFGFAATIGLIFGMFPAIKAARLDPIEALRHE